MVNLTHDLATEPLLLRRSPVCQTKMRYYRKFAPPCGVAPNLVSRIFSFSAASVIAYLSATYFNLMLVTYHPTTGERAQGVAGDGALH